MKSDATMTILTKKSPNPMSTNSINELRTSVQKKTKTIDAKSDVHGAVDQLLPGETLLLSAGVYYLDNHLVVDKDVVIKSATGNPKAVTLVRPGSTTLLVPEGAPTFENLTFISMSGQGVSAATSLRRRRYQARRCARGAPTFVGRQRVQPTSGFSAGAGLGEITRCEIRHTRPRDLLRRICRRTDRRMSLCHAEEAADAKMAEEWVEIRGSRLIRSAYANLSRGGGRVRISKTSSPTIRSPRSSRHLRGVLDSLDSVRSIPARRQALAF